MGNKYGGVTPRVVVIEGVKYTLYDVVRILECSEATARSRMRHCDTVECLLKPVRRKFTKSHLNQPIVKKKREEELKCLRKENSKLDKLVRSFSFTLEY